MPNSGMNAAGPSNDEYCTPPWLFRALDTEFGFTFDAAANKDNHLCSSWTAEIDEHMATTKAEQDPIWRYFCNPPYSMIDIFVKHALNDSTLWVLLLPSRTGTAWFQRLNESPRVEIRFLRKRIRFCLGGKEEASPRFDSLIAIVRPAGQHEDRIALL